LILDRKWLRIREERVRLESGVEIDEFHVVEGVDWVAVLALTDAGEIVLVDQYRHGARIVSRELPAGVIERHEAPLEAAKRELLEETGYAADEWLPLIDVATEPSRHTTRAHFFVARRARRVAEPNLDQSEEIQVVLMPRQELLNQLDRGVVQHGVHIGAVLLAERRGLLQP
jgi:8-oxo-dGTP pyrophosphatase MutT (NUDIX family)